MDRSIDLFAILCPTNRPEIGSIGNGGTMFYVIQSPLEKALNLLTAITLADLLETRWIFQGRHWDRVEVTDCDILIQQSTPMDLHSRNVNEDGSLREKEFFCFWIFWRNDIISPDSLLRWMWKLNSLFYAIWNFEYCIFDR